MYGFGFRLKQRYADTVGLFSQDTLLQQRAALNLTAVYLTPEICCWSGDKTKDFLKIQTRLNYISIHPFGVF